MKKPSITKLQNEEKTSTQHTTKEKRRKLQEYTGKKKKIGRYQNITLQEVQRRSETGRCQGEREGREEGEEGKEEEI